MIISMYLANKMLPKTYSKLKKAALIGLSTVVLYFGAQSCFFGDNKEEGELEKRMAKVEQTVEARQYPLLVNNVIKGLSQHPEYADELLEASMDVAGRDDSYSDKTRVRMWRFAVDKMEEKPELTEHLGPNARQYMKRKSINGAATKVVEKVYDGITEGVKIIKGE